jgi:hypothetical protein
MILSSNSLSLGHSDRLAPRMQSDVLGATAELAEAPADYVKVVAAAELDLSAALGLVVYALSQHPQVASWNSASSLTIFVEVDACAKPREVQQHVGDYRPA